MLYSLIKPLLFAQDPETIHNMALHLAKLSPQLGELTGIKFDPRLEIQVGATNWTFPIGLAAGLDKNAEAISFFCNQGFGAVECGTITLLPQGGNPRPRIFRYPSQESLRNAMGFPNQGLLEVMPRLKEYRGRTPLGVNLGKNKDTSPEESIEELSVLFETLRDYASYFVVNVSSPNTPGLRALQEKVYLSELFAELNRSRNGKDLFLKIAPDLAPDKIRELTHLAADFKLTGIIATNTTLMPEYGGGGISGKLLSEKSKVVRRIILEEATDLEIIAVGGISTPKDLFELWNDGGKVAQVYTAYVYQGPKLLKNFYSEISNFLETHKMKLSDFFLLPLAERRYRLKGF